jgi:uncharacterized protein (DUF1684 family)
MSIEQEYMQALQHFRSEKDDFFRTSPESPIPLDERKDFTGLRYYPAYFALRLMAQIEALPDNTPVQMATSDGATRDFVKAARLRFAIEGQEQTLIGYRSADDADEPDAALFIPFRDALAGKETYGAGRYLDVHPEAADDGTPIVVLDFNLAYNPYCAYNDSYSCPITPAENALPIAIHAGERNYHE